MYIKDDERSPFLPPHALVKSVNIVHYKPTPDRLQQIEQHGTVQQHENERLNRNWPDEVTIAKHCEQHLIEFSKHLTEYEDMWDGNFGRITMAKQRIKLAQNNVRTVHSAPYRAGSKARLFAVTETDCMREEDIIEPTTTECASRSYSTPRRTARSHSASTTVDATQ